MRTQAIAAFQKAAAKANQVTIAALADRYAATFRMHPAEFLTAAPITAARQTPVRNGNPDRKW